MGRISIIFHFIACLVSSLLSCQISAQEVNYHEHIEPIITTHCTRCHQPNNVAPFSLLTYDDVSPRAKFIGHVTKTKYMPPFKADATFQHYKNENTLTPDEIQLIQDWVAGGLAKGKRNSKKIPDVHAVTSDMASETNHVNHKTESLDIGMQQRFILPEKGKEEFRFFHIPVNNKTEKYIQSIRFIPGNKKLVHHSRVMTDTSGTTAGIDGLSESDTAIYKFQTKPLADPFLFGWVPGNDQIVFPEGTGKKLFPGTDFIFNMHYSPSPIIVSDSSSIHIQFAEKPAEREVVTLTLKEDNISNLPFVIKANTSPIFYLRSAMIEEDVSLISIMPHMHLLGKRFKAFAVTPGGDLIPLVNIPDWDFNWQMTYTFKNFIYVPKGSVIYAEAQYDNTQQNPRNPTHPPKDVGYGWGTKDEMMNLVIYYVKYRAGDEKIEL